VPDLAIAASEQILSDSPLSESRSADVRHTKESLLSVLGENDAVEEMPDEPLLWGLSVDGEHIGVKCSGKAYVERGDEVPGGAEVSEGSKIGGFDAILRELLVAESLLGVGPGLGFDVLHFVGICGLVVEVPHPGLVDGDFSRAEGIWNDIRGWVVVASRDQERHDEQESWPSGHDGMIRRAWLEGI
jgi:hypothetical protein